MIPGYKIIEEIYRGRKRVVYRAERVPDSLPVIIKTFIADFPPEKDTAGLKREFEILHNLRMDGVAKAYGIEKDHNRLALILEDIGGESLRTLIDSDKIDLIAFLKIGIRLSEIVAELHQNNTIHKDINPKNIIVNLRTNQIQLIDFSISSRLPQENQEISHPNLLEGTLAYISPEQTGRMNRAIDYRTDFYSLGVTFYEMLTGRLPFYSADPLELVHFHIAKIPATPCELNTDIPKAVSDIVMKLLAKTAEDRYKSAWGLKSDLGTCLTKWEKRGKIEAFVPGENDFSDRFEIPQKLYGRDKEIEILMTAFERVSSGATEIMLVSGYSGIGKSALVNEVHKPIVRQRGYFVSGKFDQFKRNIPYSAVIQAFQELVRQLLTESEKEVEAWKYKIAEALTPNAQVIIDVIPEVELIVGKQPLVPELPPAESQNRFNLVFGRFIGVFARKEHPLVVFLDDLQWADSATLKLLNALMTEPGIECLLMIGAYRDNEVSPTHPLTLTLAEIEKAGARVKHITLGPLELAHLTRLIADALRCETGRSKPLAELVLGKTDGNPFFLTQFLKSLYQENLLRLDHESGGWQFDLEHIRRMGMTDNVVELMVRKIQKLPEGAQGVLKLAACIGNRFDLNTLSVVNEKPLIETASDLWEAVKEGLVISTSDFGFEISDLEDSTIRNLQSAVARFLHDRVQQAAYALIPDGQKKAVHLKVGRLMLKDSRESRVEGRESEENIFDVVNHLNTGVELIAGPEEKKELAALNLQAGRKAKSSTAYKTALSYFHVGLSLLAEDSWTSDYDFTFALYTELAECEYLCGNLEASESAFDLLLERARTRLDKAEVYKLKIMQYESMSRYKDAISLGREALALFGLSYYDTQEEREAALEAEISAIQALVDDRHIESLIDLPIMKDPEIRVVMKLLTYLHTPCYLSADKILTLLNTSLMVRLSLIHGNVEESAYAYVLHAMHIGPIRGDFKSAYEFGTLARRLSERFNNPGLRARVLMNFAWNVSLWRMPMEASIPITREAFQLANDSGLFVEAAYALFNECYFILLADQDLANLQETGKANVDYIKRIKMHHFAQGGPQVILQWGRALQGLTEHPFSLTDADPSTGSGRRFDETAFREIYKGQGLFEMFYSVAKLAVLYTFDEYQAARDVASEAERVIRNYTGTIWDELTVFYHALSLSALYSVANPSEQKEYEVKLETFKARLKLWAENCPHNYRPQYLIVSAEAARVRGMDAEAMILYEAAIEAAAEQECPRDRALVNELYAKFWLKRGNEKIAKLYMAEAHYVCEQWGAAAKAKDLEKRYPHLLLQSHASAGTPIADSQIGLTTVGFGSEVLDLTTVIKASQVISGEIFLRRLLERLMKIVIENAGAQKGVLILEKEGELLIEAVGATGSSTLLTTPLLDKDEATVLHFTPVRAVREPPLPQTIVNYVRRTSENLVLADAGSDAKFANDPYIVQNKPKSILCAPIVYQGKLIGILYLENNLTTDAFTPDRVQVVQILSSQAAISLENARLYDEMKQEITQRKQTEETLQKTLGELEQLKNRLQVENVYLQEEIKTEYNFEEIIGQSESIKRVLRKVEQVAHTDTTVLIHGETGTGKELIARAIHNLSNRKDRPLVKVNCGAISAGLVESELFGHEKGAFTGAVQRRIGRFELASGGTIFLDEVSELPLDTQVKLLRVLQEGEFERVGSSKPIEVDVRVIAATNRDLAGAVKYGSFRSDLFYRLNVFPIEVPPLRERPSDIPLLANFFVTKYAKKLSKQFQGISNNTMNRFIDYSWPGNIRELQNMIERAVVLSHGSEVEIDESVLGLGVVPEENGKETLEEVERDHILRVLAQTNWVINGKKGAASILDINPNTLRSRMQKLGIKKPELKS